MTVLCPVCGHDRDVHQRLVSIDSEGRRVIRWTCPDRDTFDMPEVGGQPVRIGDLMIANDPDNEDRHVFRVGSISWDGMPRYIVNDPNEPPAPVMGWTVAPPLWDDRAFEWPITEVERYTDPNVNVDVRALAKLVDDNPCHITAEGNCQTHDQILEDGEECPVAKFRKAIEQALGQNEPYGD